MVYLEIIAGPMFSGKTSELFRKINTHAMINKNYLIIKPSIDSRHSDFHIVTHNLNKIECISLAKLSDIISNVKFNSCTTIFIDEGQFFTDLKDSTLEILEKYNKNVIISGLIGDFNRNKFGQILDLIPYCECDKITFLSALCLHCMDGTSASFSHRNVNSRDQVLVGDNYTSLCRKHFLELN